MRGAPASHLYAKSEPFTPYDNQACSLLQTDRQFPAVGSLTKGLLVNADGSVDAYFGPKTPAGKELV
jgi:hypothetical protein